VNVDDGRQINAVYDDLFEIHAPIYNWIGTGDVEEETRNTQAIGAWILEMCLVVWTTFGPLFDVKLVPCVWVILLIIG